uniref:olfactory receptor 52N2-like n=1 Tax=Myxine glutinosa TaxID=7769 RepID=UPI00359023CA
MRSNTSIIVSSPDLFLLDPSHLPRTTTAFAILWTFGVLVFFGVFLNGLVVTACGLRCFDKPMVTYIAVASVVDIFWGVTGMTSYTYSMTIGPKLMRFADCLTQMFFLHVALMGQFLVISLMYVDRHCAIFWPFTYAHWTAKRSGPFKTLAVVWFLAVALGLVFVVAATWLNFCSSTVVINDAICYYGMVSTAACGNKRIPNTVTGVVLYLVVGHSAVVAAFSTCCIIRKCRKDTGSKALHTCLSQLFFFLSHFLSIMVTSFLNRGFISNKDAHFVFILIVNSIPLIVNPLVFGLRTKEIRTPIARVLRRCKNDRRQVTSISK